MKVSVIAKVILDDKLGKLVKEDIVELPEHKANFYLERGDVVRYQTKVVYESPVAPEVSVEAEEGEKKRGRKPKTWLTK